MGMEIRIIKKQLFYEETSARPQPVLACITVDLHHHEGLPTPEDCGDAPA